MYHTVLSRESSFYRESRLPRNSNSRSSQITRRIYKAPSAQNTTQHIHSLSLIAFSLSSYRLRCPSKLSTPRAGVHVLGRLGNDGDHYFYSRTASTRRAAAWAHLQTSSVLHRWEGDNHYDHQEIGGPHSPIRDTRPHSLSLSLIRRTHTYLFTLLENLNLAQLLSLALFLSRPRTHVSCCCCSSCSAAALAAAVAELLLLL